MFFNHAAKTFSQTFNLKAFWYSSDERDWVYCRANLFEQAAYEAGLVHRILKEVFPEVIVILFFGEGDGLGDVRESTDDKVKSSFRLASLGKQEDQFRNEVTFLAFLRCLELSQHYP